MNSENYVENALRTDTPLSPELLHRIGDPETIRLIHAVFGMVTETGEFADMLKKHIFYGRPLDFVNGKEELGDTMWYIALAVDVMQTTLNEVLTMNIDKLRLRYPDKFSESDAINRDVVGERKLLERQQEPTPDIEFFGYEGVSDAEYLAMNNLRGHTKLCSMRGADWLNFSHLVFEHIENYTVPQYGDKDDDQVTHYTSTDCIKQVQKYAARFGRNSREGQQEKDFIKMAHYTQLAYEKYVHEEDEDGLPIVR